MWSIADLYTENTLTLKWSDTMSVAKELIISEGVNQLPILKDGKIEQLISLEDLELLEEDSPLSQIDHFRLNSQLSVHLDSHYFEALQIIADDSSLLSLPVVDEEEQFKGVVKLKDILAHYVPQNVTYNEASWVVLVMPSYEYSLTRISDIVEYNRCKILQVLTKVDEENNLWLQILINSSTISSSLKSFERFGYKVAYVNSPGKDIDSDTRYQSLMKYLDL